MEAQVRQYASLAVAANREGRWQDALRYAHACRELAPVGSKLQTWAFHMLACTYADLGRTRESRAWSAAYLRWAPQHPELERFTPWVVHALASVCYLERRFREAASLYQKAVKLFERTGNPERADGVRTSVVWSLVRAGRPAEARDYLNTCLDRSHYLFIGAECAVLASEGRWVEAVLVGKAAITAERQSCDFTDAAEVCLLIAQAMRTMGDRECAATYIKRAASFAARQERDVFTLLLLNQRGEGGDCSAQADAHGSADLRDRGVFCTGVA